MNVLAIVPARGGSKGITRKNIASLAGQPLLSYTVRAALACPLISRTVVSSDDAEVLKLAAALGATPLTRPAELATDEAAMAPVIVHALEAELAAGRSYDALALLQPTSPLRNAQDIQAAITQMDVEAGNSLISVSSAGRSPHKALVLGSDGGLRGLVDDDAPFARRQDLPETYLANGAIYLARTRGFLETRSLLIPRCCAFEMSAAKSIDIDTPEDLARAEGHLAGSTA